MVQQESPADARVTRDSAVILRWRLFRDGAFLHYTYVFRSTPKIRIKIDPYCRRQECRPKIDVSTKVWDYADIPGGSLERGRQMRVHGVGFSAIFDK